MIEKYPKQWIAVHDGEVKVRASALRQLLQEMDRLGVPCEHAIVRYIEKDHRTIIL